MDNQQLILESAKLLREYEQVAEKRLIAIVTPYCENIMKFNGFAIEYQNQATSVSGKASVLVGIKFTLNSVEYLWTEVTEADIYSMDYRKEVAKKVYELILGRLRKEIEVALIPEFKRVNLVP